MIEKKGNIWSAFTGDGIIVIPSSSSLNKKGHLVMARGLARQVRMAHPGIEEVLGACIKRTCGSGGYFQWLYMPQLSVYREEMARFALLQTKRKYKNEIDVELTREGLWSVHAVALYKPERDINITNITGVDMSGLPDNVIVWRR